MEKSQIQGDGCNSVKGELTLKRLLASMCVVVCMAAIFTPVTSASPEAIKSPLLRLRSEQSKLTLNPLPHFEGAEYEHESEPSSLSYIPTSGCFGSVCIGSGCVGSVCGSNADVTLAADCPPC